MSRRRQSPGPGNASARTASSATPGYLWPFCSSSSAWWPAATGLIALGITLLIIVGISTIWKNLSLFGVSYERRFDRTRVFPRRGHTHERRRSERQRLPLTWLRFRDQLPVPPDIANSPLSMSGELTGNFVLQSVFSMQSQGASPRTVLRFPVRGYYHIGPVSYESGDIFTLFTREREHKYIDTLIVYPQIWPLEGTGPAGQGTFGEVKVRHNLFTDPIRTGGIRDYMPQDRFRDVHWKATARRGHLQTKVYDPSTGMTLAVFLNVATFARHWMDSTPICWSAPSAWPRPSATTAFNRVGGWVVCQWRSSQL